MNIIVTGTSRGLGRAIAEQLSKDGHTVIGCSRTKIEQDKFLHINGVDFKEPNTFSLLEPYLADADGLVNNAAIVFDGLLATQGEKSISDIIQVNLVSTMILTKNYIRARLKQRKSGSIVNISSIISIRGYSGLSVYTATKAGINGMTRSLARELGTKGFRVNSVLPGYMDTEMSKDLSQEQRNTIIRRTPLGRLATVDDVTPVVKFLLSDDSKFITGQSIVIDGGITV